MSNFIKKILSLLLAIVIITSNFITPVFAISDTSTETSTEMPEVIIETPSEPDVEVTTEDSQLPTEQQSQEAEPTEAPEDTENSDGGIMPIADKTGSLDPNNIIEEFMESLGYPEDKMWETLQSNPTGIKFWNAGDGGEEGGQYGIEAWNPDQYKNDSSALSSGSFVVLYINWLYNVKHMQNESVTELWNIVKTKTENYRYVPHWVQIHWNNKDPNGSQPTHPDTQYLHFAGNPVSATDVNVFADASLTPGDIILYANTGDSGPVGTHVAIYAGKDGSGNPWVVDLVNDTQGPRFVLGSSAVSGAKPMGAIHIDGLLVQNPDTGTTSQHRDWGWKRDVTLNLHEENAIDEPLQGAQFEVTLSGQGQTETGTLSTDSKGDGSITFTIFNDTTHGTAYSDTINYVKNYASMSPEDKAACDALGYKHNEVEAQAEADEQAYTRAHDAEYASMQKEYTLSIREITVPEEYKASVNATQSWTFKGSEMTEEAMALPKGETTINRAFEVDEKVLETTAISYAVPVTGDVTEHSQDTTVRKVQMIITKQDTDHPEIKLSDFQFDIFEENTVTHATKTEHVTTGADGTATMTFTHNLDSGDLSATVKYLKTDYDLLSPEDQATYASWQHASGKNAEQEALASASEEAQRFADQKVVNRLKELANENYRYTITETNAAPPYVLDNTPIVRDVANGDEELVTIQVTQNNTTEKGQITIIKQAEGLDSVTTGSGAQANQFKVFNYTDKTFAGATFDVYAYSDISDYPDHIIYHAGDKIGTYTTSGPSGSVVVSGLYMGRYRIVETQSPEGLCLPKIESDRTHLVTISYGGQNVPVISEPTTFVNDRPSVKVTATKKDADDNTALSGAEFTLYAAEDILGFDGTVKVPNGTAIETAISDSVGLAVFKSDLPIGYDFVIKETKAPENYIKNEKEFRFTTSYDGQETYNYSYTDEFTDIPQRGVITIVKKGDVLNTVTNGSGNKYKSFNYITGNLQGAEYDLYANEDIWSSQQTQKWSAGQLIEHLVTGPDGTVKTSELYIGEYRIVETKAPTGYLLPEDIADRTHYVDIKYGGQDIKVVDMSSDFENDRPAYTIDVLKEDSEDNTTIQNGEFTIYNKTDITNVNGEVVVPAGTALEKVVTDVNGKASFTVDLPINYDYYVEETLAPTNYYNLRERWDISYTYKNDSTPSYSFSHTFLDQPVKGTIDVSKVDLELFDNSNPRAIDKNGTQGDATLAGAVYELYAREDIEHPNGKGSNKFDKDDLVATLATDENGRLEFTDLYLGKYYIKEKTPSEGYLLDETVYEITISYEDQDTPFVEGKITPSFVSDEILTSKEQVIEQGFQILKFAPSENEHEESTPLQGVEFTVKLKSDVEKMGWDDAPTYDVLVTDDEGEACSIDLPYGTYVVRETKVPFNRTPVKDFEVYITEHHPDDPQPHLPLSNPPLETYVRLIKRDAETGRVVLLPNTTFKLKDANGDYVVQKVGADHVDTFITDERGLVQTPLKMLHGTYYVCEIHAPYGYVLDTDELEFEIVSGVYRVDDDGDLVVDVYFDDVSTKGRIQVTKHGEGLVDYGVAHANGMTTSSFVYGDKPLAGAVYEIVAAEDIMSADNNNIVVYAKGTVADTITTDATGTATTKDLPLGHYTVREITAPFGYVVSEGDAVEQSAVLTYEGETVPLVWDRTPNYKNERQKVSISLIKTDSESGEVLGDAEFGLYNREDILDFDGNVLVPKDTLIENGITSDDGLLKFKADLPLGKYYLKELRAPDGYVTLKDPIEIDASYQGQTVHTVISESTPEDTKTWITISKKDKLSDYMVHGATMQVLNTNNDPDNLQVVEGPAVDEWITTADAVHDIRGLLINTYYALREVQAPYGYVKHDDIFFYVIDDYGPQPEGIEEDQIRGQIQITKVGEKLTGATKNDKGGYDLEYTNLPLEGVKYKLYAAEDIKNVDGVSANWYSKGDFITDLTTDANGMVTTEQLPLGKYYVEEVSTIEGFVLDTERHEIEIETEGQLVPVVITPATYENTRQKVSIDLTKTDVETNDPVRGAEFALSCQADMLNDAGEVIIKAGETIELALSGEDGVVIFESDLPVNYSYSIKEISPASGYTTNGGDGDVYEFDAPYVGADKEFSPSGELRAKNQKTKHVFSKADMETDVLLDGAMLSVLHIEKDSNGDLAVDENGDYLTTVIDSWTSDRTETVEFNGTVFNGHLIEGLVVGETYIFREVMAPEGYVGYAASDNATKEVNRESNTIEQEVIFVVKDTMDMTEHKLVDQATVGQIVVTKTGEIVVGFEEPNILEKAGAYIAHIFKYLFGATEDAVFEVYAAEDIKHPDGVSDDIYKEGDLVGRITTNYLGIAKLGDLPLGKYIVKEVKAPDAYVVNSEPREVTLAYQGQDVPVVENGIGVVNERHTIHINIMEKSSSVAEFKYANPDENIPAEPRDYPLAGAVFGLYNKEDIYANVINEDGSVTQSEDLFLPAGTLIETAVSDEFGHVEFISDLPFATYYVRELTPPVGYHLSDEVLEFSCEGADPETKEIGFTADFYNIPTVVSVDKIAADTNEGLVGTTLAVLDEDGHTVETWITDGNVHYVKHLEINKTYTLVEVEATPGYVTFEPMDFLVHDRTEDNEVIELEILSAIVDDYTKLEVSKKDMQTGDELPGATLQIFDAEGEMVMEWVSEDEPNFIIKLPVGEYTLHEALTPAGYVTADDIPFTVEDTGNIQRVEMLDDVTKVQISKKDMVISEELPGATLQILDAEGEMVVEWTSEEEAFYIEKLPVGKYTLHEALTPAGYVTADDIEFTVEDTGEVQFTEMLDDITKLEISKKDMVTEEELPGAELQLFDEEGNLVDEWTSEETAHYMEKIPVGNYVLHEKTTPAGYVTADDVEITVKDTGDVQHADMLDDITKVEISKKDSVTSEELVGAELQLLDSNGNVIDEWTSEAEPHYIEKLPIGDYTIHETSAPAGYVTADDVKFTVEDTGEIQKAEMLDDITKLEVSKKDKTVETEDELLGARLRILDQNGNVIDEWVTEAEPHYIEKLPVGEYILHEESTPDGYVTSEDIKFTVNDTPEVQKLEMLDDVTKVEFFKKDSATGNMLAGVVLQILDADGNVIREWTSSSNEPFRVEKLPVGNYRLHEVEAPKGYLLSADLEFTVEDTAEVQAVTMEDKPAPTPTPAPEQIKTGEDATNNSFVILSFALILVGVVAIIFIKKKREDNK